jgi:uncharacterized protein YutE (UPF0331/DUF86 family)
MQYRSPDFAALHPGKFNIIQRERSRIRVTKGLIYMKLIEIFESQVEVCEIHRQRLETALKHIQHLLPFTKDKLKNLTDEEFGFLELFTNRYCKLQDMIGNKIYSFILEFLQEKKESESFIDRLNKLEKLEILPSSKHWLQMREIRNHITHEYPDHPEFMVSNLNKAIEFAKSLLEYWRQLKEKFPSIIKKFNSYSGGK